MGIALVIEGRREMKRTVRARDRNVIVWDSYRILVAESRDETAVRSIERKVIVWEWYGLLGEARVDDTAVRVAERNDILWDWYRLMGAEVGAREH